MRTLASVILVILLGATAIAQSPPPPEPYLTRPAISPHGSKIAFAADGAIWTVASRGGVAHVLVSEKGNPTSPVFSPDGSRLAFTAERGGVENIFVLDRKTGAVKRLTFDDGGDELDAWSHDGRWIYFSTTADNIAYMNSVYRVRSDGGTPMPVTSELYINEHYAAPSPDGRAVAFTARGVANWQWWRKGHSHLDDSAIWLLAWNPARHYQRVSLGGAEELWPMWSANGRSIYYVSDRTGPANVWVRPLGGAPRQITRFTDGRVVWPQISADGKTIIFARHFGIWKLDPKSGHATQVPIVLGSAVVSAPVKRQPVSGHIRELALSPDGKKLAFVAHGTIFAALASKPGRAIRITRAPVNHSELAWSPNSRKLVFVSDRDGEPRLYLYDFSTRKESKLTATGEDYAPIFSPDGAQIAFKRDGHELCALDLASGKIRVLAQAHFGMPPITDPRSIVWSPDGRWIAYSSFGARTFRNIRAVPSAGGPSRSVTFLANTEGRDPHWSPNGKFMLYVSGQRTKVARVARIDLAPPTPRFVENRFWNSFRKNSPVAGAVARKPGAKSASTAKSAHKARPVKIDFTRIRHRLAFLPIGLNVDRMALSPNGKLLVVTAEVAGRQNLFLYPIDRLAEKPPVARQLTSTRGRKSDVQFTPDGKKIFYLSDGKIFTVAVTGGKPAPFEVAGGMNVSFAREKYEVFHQAWRYLRDNFWNPRMNGVNWDAVRAEYAPLVAGAASPNAFYSILRLMIGELDSSHSGIYAPRGKTHPVEGRLGLVFDVHKYERSGELLVKSVVPRSPGALAGVHAGDVLLAVDGETIGRHSDLHEFLANRIGRLVTLRLGGPHPRDVNVKPVATPALKNLLYHEWIAWNRAYVARLSGGRLGYVHLQAMERGDLRHLDEELSSRTEKLAGVVIDIRDNEGGFVNPYAIDVLARRGYLRIVPRGLPEVGTRTLSGERALERPTILVVNRGTLSDGEDFTQGYRALHLGKVVGEPTAGWILYTWAGRLMNGARVRLPHARVLTEDGRMMEMHPRPVDIQVARPVGQSYQGRDSQLAAAVRALLEQIGPPAAAKSAGKGST